MGKKGKKRVVDPIADVKANPSKVTVVWLNPGAAQHGNEIYDALPDFPTEVLACKNLVELEIFRGIVDGTIPREIGTLTKLKSLGLGGLDTVKLPDEIGNLVNLEKLDFTYSECLAALPKTIGKLTKLHTLEAQDTALTELPREIGALTKLKTLNLHNSQLARVPAELWKAKSLEVLAFPACLAALPPGISALTKLHTLTASAPALASVAGELAKLKSLVTLHVATDYSDDIAMQLPDEIADLPAIETLAASYLGLTRLPVLPATLTTLELGGNKLSSIIDAIAALPKLRELELDDNPIPVAERRELDKLMKLSPSKRAAALAKRAPAKPAAKPAKAAAKPAKKAKPKLLGNVASINASLSMVLGDAKVMTGWRGVGDGDDLEESDWQRAIDALAARDFAMLDVGKGSAVALTFGIGQGIAKVFRVGERLVLVESFADADDELYVEWIESAPSKARSVANLAIPSGKLLLVPATEEAASDEALTVDAWSKVSISIEPESKGSWGHGRRCFVAPA